MAVENKFKLNVIAASVLMGLSLSAVAADSNTAAKTDTKAVGTTTETPAKVKTLAESAAAAAAVTNEGGHKTGVAAAVDVNSIEVTPTNGGKSNLLHVLQTSLGGQYVGKDETDTSKKKAYDDALSKVQKLSPEQQEVAKNYNSTKESFVAAQTAFKEFEDTALKGARDTLNQKLAAVYGGTPENPGYAFTISEGSKGDGTGAAITINSTENTPFNDYLSSFSDQRKGLLTKLESLQSGAYEAAGGDGGAGDSVKNANKAVTAYTTYLQDYQKVAELTAKQEAVEGYIKERMPDFLKIIEAHRKETGNTGGDAKNNVNLLDGKFKAYTEAVSQYQNAKNDTDRSNARSVAYTALNDIAELVNKSKVQGLTDAEKTAVEDFGKSLAAVHTLLTKNDGIDAELAVAQKSLGTAIKPDGTGITNVDKVEIKSPGDALAGIKTYLTQIVKATEGYSAGSGKALIESVQAASKAFQSAQTEYNEKHQALVVADANLNGLSAQWKELNDNYVKTADAFRAAEDAYNKGGDKSVSSVLEGLASAKDNYISALNGVSEGIQLAFDSAKQTYVKAVGKDGSADTQEKKNAALYTLIGQQKQLASAKLAMDTELLKVQSGDMDKLSSDLSKAQASTAEAGKQYTTAVKEYLAATKAQAADDTVENEAAVATAKNKLLWLTGTTDSDFAKTLLNSGDVSKGFKSFDELPTANQGYRDESGNFVTLSSVQNQLYTSDGKSDIQTARSAAVDSMKTLVSLMPLSTSEEQAKFRQQYNESLSLLQNTVVDADAQSKLANAESITHYLGSLDDKEIAQYNPASGQFNSVIVNTDANGNITGVKDNFTAKDLYTGTKDKPFTTTVLDIRALELGNGALADTNTITVGEAGSKATPIEVWAKTAGVKHSGDESSSYVSAEHGPAVKLSENLRTATAQLDENGKPVEGQVVRGADQIHLQNVNIHNSFTLADRVQMLKDDVAALNQQAADKLALGQPADGEKGVNAWLKGQTDLLNSKYDKLGLTGLQIDTTTVNPVFDVDNGVWTTAAETAIPTEANILLDNLNITLQNDSVGGISTAIDLSGTGNHILASGGVFDAGKADNLAQAYVLNITGKNNRIDFNSSVLNGDISSGATGNTVNLNKGSTLTGDVSATNHDYLSLNLDNSTWNGGAGPNSPDVSLSNNSVWNVKGYNFNANRNDFPESSVHSLTLNGNNTLNLVSSTGLAQLGGRGFTGSKYGVTLNVDTDLTSDGKGVSSVLAGTYSPDNLHSLTNTGLADGYQFGSLYVDGLARGGKYALSVESSGAEPYTIRGRLADAPYATSAHEFVSYKTSESRPVTDKDGKTTVAQIVKSDADFTSQSAPAELGVYQYAAEKVIDAVNNRTNIYYSSTGKLSNSAATVVSLAAAPVDVANLESDTLAKHMNSVRHGKDSGVWLSYFGGENRNTTAVGPEYKLKTNGVMLGVDTLTENNWLAGVAVSSARSEMSVMNSSGDLDSYGAQFYMSRRYDSGVFVDGALQFNHFSNTAKARMINGQQAKADFSGNSYGLEAKVGYAWNSEGFFAEPYVRAAARAFDGEHYALSNGMTVNSNDYKSMLGEVGADLGYQYDISGGYVKPYLHLAALNEFADGNSVRVNNVSLDNSVKGAAFQAGLGAEVKVTDNLGGYAAFDYTKGDNTERPWQATVGVNYTW
ncbi:TPA: autotransporter outer membrane beta-barrel domain-containing protein [Salmonella enterica]|nr:autotransporter outer membrane beta-barrel domain-containing protein [Salmonella enterica]